MAGAIEICLWCLLLAATVTDIVWGKIFNAITLPFLAGGIAVRLLSGGIPQAITAFLAVLVAFSVFFPLYWSKIMAAGDVKLLMAIGAWIDWKLTLQLAATTVVIGALGGLIILIARKGTWGGLKSLSDHVQAGTEKKSTRMPFAPAFLCAYSFIKIAELKGWSVY